ncbi:hypothetical protein FPOA_12323 [Fusarium poae]|uniref:Peptide hydrolase n=1 Tax=Fusarium poae TaxID=36050 RepID=A0A1B8A9J2_FUSPO|nr:hypothetical protein FPOA_12323 [Fusarium poae]
MRFGTTRATLMLLAPIHALAKSNKLDSVSFQADIKTDNLLLNLEALNDISFDSGGNRAFGLPGYNASADYIYKRVSEVKNAEVRRQYFTVISASVNFIDLRVDDKPIHISGLTYSPSTSGEGITAEIALGPEGAAGCDASSYGDLDVKGKIVLVQRFSCPNSDTLAGRVMAGAAAGASAVIFYHDLSTNVTGGSLSSGSSLILELFIALSNYKTENRIRFAWWGAEEKGLLGSTFYTSNLAITDVNDLLVYLNFDMVGNGYFGVADTDGSSYGSKAPKGSEATEKIFADYFTSQGIETTPVALTNGSDYASFWQNLNKPFGFLHTGTGVEQDPCYHQACDTIDNVNSKTLTINAKAAAHILATLDERGSKLIPKTKVTDTTLHSLQQRSVGTHLG